MDAVVGEVFVLLLHVGDGGFHVENALRLEGMLQGFVQLLADALALLVPIYVDGGLHRPLVGSPSVEDVGIGIAHDASVFFCQQVGVVLAEIFDALAKLFLARHLILEGDGGLCHIGGIDGEQDSCIVGGCWSDVDLFHRRVA